MHVHPYLLAAGAAYLAGMFVSVSYACLCVIRLLRLNPVGETKRFVFMYLKLIGQLQLPKLLVSGSAAGVGMALFSNSACSAVVVAAFFGFAAAWYPFAKISHRPR